MWILYLLLWPVIIPFKVILFLLKCIGIGCFIGDMFNDDCGCGQDHFPPFYFFW